MEKFPIAGDSLHYDDNEEEEQTTVMELDSDYEKTESDSERTESDSDDTADSKRVNDPFRALTAFATMARVYEGSNAYKSIVKGFNSGMGSAAGATEVMAVHVPRFSNEFSRNARVAMFEEFTEAVGRQCGSCRDHAVRFGCYFGSKEEIARIVAHGFSSLNGDEFGKSFGEYLENKNRPQLIERIKDIVGNDNVIFQAFNRCRIRNQCPHGKHKQPARKC